MAETRIPVEVSGMALVVGPDDVLVINIGRASAAQFREIAALFEDGAHPTLKGRVLIVTADQLAVIQGGART